MLLDDDTHLDRLERQWKRIIISRPTHRTKPKQASVYTSMWKAFRNPAFWNLGLMQYEA